MEILVTKKFSFSSAHRLYNLQFSEDKNREVFGECSNFHGHNYVLEVSVTGEVDGDSGFIMNFRDIKSIVKKSVIEKLDHKNLNELEEFKNKTTTAENILVLICELLKNEGLNIKRLKLWETSDSLVELNL